MKFEEVLQAAREGKKVKLKGHDGIYEIKQNRLIYRGVDDEYFPTYHSKFTMTNYEIMSEDWEVIDEPI